MTMSQVPSQSVCIVIILKFLNIAPNLHIIRTKSNTQDNKK